MNAYLVKYFCLCTAHNIDLEALIQQYFSLYLSVLFGLLFCTYFKLLNVYLFVDSLTFHVMVEGGLVYLCASESDFGKRQPYAFLNEVLHTCVLFLI